MIRMALAGASPRARDWKEICQMGAEKSVAFAESWTAMTVQAFLANYELSVSFWRSYWRYWLSGKSSTFTASQMRNAAFGILHKGISPIHRRAVANAKRLARRELR